MEIAPSAPKIATTDTKLRAAGVVIASTFGNALSVTPTVSAVFGVVLVPITLEFHWSRAGVSFAAALVSLTTAVASPIAGWMADVAGPRRTALIGSLALGMAILSLGFAGPQPALFYFQFALVGLAGALQGTMVYAKLLSEWFDERRGLWMGVASGASGLGSTFMPLLAGVTLTALGWRGSFVCVALVVLLVGLPIQFFLLAEAPIARHSGRDRPDQQPDLEGFTARQAFRTGIFWLLMTSLPVGGGLLVAVAVTIVPIVMDRGISLAIAASTIATVGLTSSVGEASIGFLLDHSKTPRPLSCLYSVAILGLCVLLASHGALAILAGALIGIGMAGEFSALSFLMSRYFGRKALGTLSGVGFGFMLVVGSIATVALNAIYDSTGSYRIAILAIIPLLVWNTLAPLLLGRYRYHAGPDVQAAATS